MTILFVTAIRDFGLRARALQLELCRVSRGAALTHLFDESVIFDLTGILIL